MLKVNEYFEGRVKSIAFKTATLPATVGVMEPGAYTFNTAEKEAVTIISGAMNIQQPGSDDWHSYQVGDTFYVAADSAFKLKISENTAYLCLYG